MICKRCGKDVVGSNKCLYCGNDLKPFADQKVDKVNESAIEQDHAQNSSQTCTDKGININNSNSNTASTGTSDQNYSTTKKKNGILAVIGPFAFLSLIASLPLPFVGMLFPDLEWVDYIPYLMILLMIPFLVLIICALVSTGSFGKRISSQADDKIAVYPNLVPHSGLVKYYMKNRKVKLAGMCFANSFMFKLDKNTSEYEGFIHCKYFNIYSDSIQLSQDINMKSSFNKAKNFITLDDLKISKINTYEEMYALIGAIAIFTKSYCENYNLCAIKMEDRSCEDNVEFIISVTHYK